MDDILIATLNDPKLYEEIVHEVLRVLEEESLFLKVKKCRFKQKEVDFLGYCISEGAIKINPSKCHGLEEWPRVCKNVKEV